ncbi:MAG: hypothetical protein HC866_25105 [Leptolyngbyaceae cyanobacterium RU_5_1]|nr:hypothetical protein [Leptolyngbyaceae cyanobacterium RU_5_1]
MSKRFFAHAVLITASVIGLVSIVSVVFPSFVEASSDSNSNRQEEVPSATTQALPPQPMLVAQSTALTGTWKANDGATYYVRQIGDQLWWYGEQNPTQPNFSNVFVGTISGITITGNWRDVPKGGANSSGSLKLKIVNFSRLEKITGSNFSGSVWTR